MIIRIIEKVPKISAAILMIVESFNLNGYDLILGSNQPMAKGVIPFSV